MTYTYHFHAVSDDGIRKLPYDGLYHTDRPIDGESYLKLRDIIGEILNAVTDTVTIVSLTFLHSSP